MEEKIIIIDLSGCKYLGEIHERITELRLIFRNGTGTT